MHMGSGPGVSGASGMHVQPFLPSRTLVIFPSAPTVTTEASWAMEAGAADSALATGSVATASFIVAWAVLVSAALVPLFVCLLQPAVAATAPPRSSITFRLFIGTLR